MNKSDACVNKRGRRLRHAMGLGQEFPKARFFSAFRDRTKKRACGERRPEA